MDDMINRISAAKPLITDNEAMVNQLRKVHWYDGYTPKKTRNIAILTFFISYIPFYVLSMLIHDATIWKLLRSIFGRIKVTDLYGVIFIILDTVVLILICMALKRHLDTQTLINNELAAKLDGEAEESGLLGKLNQYLYDVPVKYWSKKNIDIICRELAEGKAENAERAVITHRKRMMKRLFLIIVGIAAIPLAITVIKNVVTFVFVAICALIIGKITFKFMNMVADDAMSDFSDTMHSIGDGFAKSMDESAERGRRMARKNKKWKKQTHWMNVNRKKAQNYARHGNAQGTNYYSNLAERQRRKRNKDYYE